MKKRVVTAFLCMALAAGLTACGTGKGENTASSPSADTSSDAAAASQDEGTEESHINMALFTYIVVTVCSPESSFTAIKP